MFSCDTTHFIADLSFIAETRSQHDADSITSSTISWDDNVFERSFENPIPPAPSSPGAIPCREDRHLEAMRKQGAIPKTSFHHRPLPPLPEPSTKGGKHFKCMLFKIFNKYGPFLLQEVFLDGFIDKTISCEYPLD